MRDPRYPFENESLYYARSTDEMNQLWYELLAKKKKEQFINFYHNTIERLDELKKNGSVDEHSRGIRKLEDILNVL